MKPKSLLAARAGVAMLVGLAACHDKGTSPSSGLTASCSAGPDSGFAPLAVAFVFNVAGSSSYDVSFDYGDGTRTSQGFFTSSTSLNLPHVYQAPGGYTATFSVTGADGQSVTCSVGVNVLGGLVLGRSTPSSSVGRLPGSGGN